MEAEMLSTLANYVLIFYSDPKNIQAYNIEKEKFKNAASKN